MNEPANVPPGEPANRPAPVRRFFGGLLMAVGGLIAGLCGLCTGYAQIGFIIDALSPGHRGGGEFTVPTYTPILVGTVPILIGVGLFFWGRWLFRSAPGPL